MLKLLALIEYFIPQSIQDDSGKLTRARFLVVVLFILAMLGMVYNLIYFKVGNPYGGGAIVGMVLVIFTLPFYLKKTGKLHKTMHLCGFFLTMMMGTIMVTSGGAVFSGNPWWTLTPVFATLVAGGRAGRIWLLVVMVILGGTYAAELFGFTFPNFMDRQGHKAWVHFLDWFHYLGAAFVITAASLVFDYINRQALDSERETRQKTEQTSRKIEESNQYMDQSVERILKEMEKLANGDLTSQLAVMKKDDIGRLCEGFNLAVNRVREAISEVYQAVEVTAHTSDQIAEATGKSTSDSQIQTDKAASIAASTSQIVEIIAENADNARSTAESAERNGAMASEGGEVVRKTVLKMEEIADLVNQSSRSIHSLGQSTNRIGDIVSVIRGIAEKTNLLALNAAIEASHAGALGKGFGVIAEEVKELARQTTVETERIAKMIETVQAEADQVTHEMAAGGEQVAEGKELAARAGAALEQIVSSSGEVSHLIQQIAKACEEQTRQSENLFREIEELKSVAQNSSGEVNGIAESALNLGGMTRELQDLLTRFKLTRELV